MSSITVTLHKLRQKHITNTSVYFPDHHILIDYMVATMLTRIVTKVEGTMRYTNNALYHNALYLCCTKVEGTMRYTNNPVLIERAIY